MRTQYRDLPEPQPSPCPVRPEVVAQIRSARLIAEALWKTGEEYHAGAIEAPEWKARNRALWKQAEDEGVQDFVTKELRTASR